MAPHEARSASEPLPVVSLTQVSVQGRSARVFTGGAGPNALLLLHGGWGGAEMHWSPVWQHLARTCRVLAPDLPGLGDVSQPGRACLADYVSWLNELLDVLEVKRAFVVGNSFGASLAWSFAGRSADRCLGVVVVDGLPMPRTPPPLLWLGRRSFGRALMRLMLQKRSFTPQALPKAFADVERAPATLTQGLSATPEVQLNSFIDCVIAGDGPPAPTAPVLFVWGEADQLPGTALAVGRKLQSQTPGSQLKVIPAAGHFPQVEQPAEFVAALEAFVSEPRA